MAITRITHVELSTCCTKFFLRPVVRLSDSAPWAVDGSSWAEKLADFKRCEYGVYEVGVVDTVCEALAARGNCKFTDEARLAFQNACLLTAASKQVAEINTRFKLEKQVAIMPGIDYGRLVGYQQTALTCSEYLPGFGLFMKQGTGKTPVAIAAICNASLRTPDPYRAIVVVPANVLSNWEHELQEFCTTPITSVIMRGLPIKRLGQAISLVKSGAKTQVLICGYETLQGSHDVLSRIPFNMAILDEAQYVKSKATQRWKYVKLLRDRVERRLVLTGSPIANSLMDLYTLFEFIGEGASGYRTFEGFKKAYSVHDRTEYGDKFVAAQNVPQLQERLLRYSFVITKQEAMPYLPEKVFDILDVEMSAAQQAAYTLLRDQLVMEIDHDLATSENQAVTVQNVLTKLLRLSQITSGFKVIAETKDELGDTLTKRQVIMFEENPKVEAIVELVKNKPRDEKTIIWSNWLENLTALKTALEALGEKVVLFQGSTSFEDRKEAERAFNFDPDCRFFIGTPASGGTGLNLLGYPPNQPELDTHTDCTHVIYISQDWSSLKREQSEDRAHRRGTRRQVRITDVVVPNTIDIIIAEAVTDKRTNAISILDLRTMLSNIMQGV